MKKRMLNWCLTGIFKVEDEINYDICLVSKFMGERVVKLNAMERTLLELWGPLKGATIKPMGRVQMHDLPLGLAFKGLARSLGNRNRTDMKRRDEENTIRFTNLLEDAIESYLRELIAPFGLVSRVHVGIDQKTGLCRGFGFLNFVKKEDAERAVLKLNGYGYDSLILRVEWANPSTN
ncbi:hypothetical protein Goshw_019705 [Gossypium schwendimanii]|uniref:RRM domain-containing protein n=1 Tax=Gossypium schwendimanii TaxID=34291 RepID=A0A7J9N483_GOSSC|nr:hypothetical protein [Gossypium schwendimanii]